MTKNNILPLGIRDLQSLHKERTMSGDDSDEEIHDEKSDDEETGDKETDDEETDDEETGDQNREEDGLDEADLIEQNLAKMETTMSSHRLAFLAYSYTRLPCAAHKVRFDSMETPL